MPLKSPPLDDYIGQVISSKRELVLKMCRQIEAVNNTSWINAIARARHVSEYLLYGAYVENLSRSAEWIWIDDKPRCYSRWEYTPIPDSAVAEFVEALGDDDVAFMISAHSTIDPAVRDLIIERATRGRVPKYSVPNSG
jgi:hypothetical protein